MRLFTSITLVCLLSFAAGCTTSGNDIASPQIPESGQSNDFSNTPETQLECRANMIAIASQAIIYLACSPDNRYPETLEDMGMSNLVCSECGLQYSYSSSFDKETMESMYFLECPLPEDPNHGCIDNGLPSWTTTQEPSEDACRANMRTIASQAVLYFANHSRYPKTLEEMGMAGIVCPVCNMEYILTGEKEYFRVDCPLPTDPNHGFIDNNGTSWND